MTAIFSPVGTQEALHRFMLAVTTTNQAGTNDEYGRLLATGMPVVAVNSLYPFDAVAVSGRWRAMVLQEPRGFGSRRRHLKAVDAFATVVEALVEPLLPFSTHSVAHVAGGRLPEALGSIQDHWSPLWHGKPYVITRLIRPAIQLLEMSQVMATAPALIQMFGDKDESDDAELLATFDTSLARLGAATAAFEVC